MTLKGAGLLAAFKDQGVVFDSYLEDGYPGVFHDYANYIGWAMVERYISEELIGAAYSPSWGGLTQNPVIKSAVTLALDAVNPERVPFLYTQGDTIGNTPDFDANMLAFLLLQPHPNMPSVSLNRAEVADMADYILSLQRRN